MNRGLSLIEMLVVIAILAAVAGMVVSLTDNLDQRSRQQESLNRLGEIRSAIPGPDAISGDGELLSGGYLQDAGWLPDKTSDLLIQPEIVRKLLARDWNVQVLAIEDSLAGVLPEPHDTARTRTT